MGPLSHGQADTDFIRVIDVTKGVQTGVESLGNLDCMSAINIEARHDSKSFQERERL